MNEYEIREDMKTFTKGDIAIKWVKRIICWIIELALLAAYSGAIAGTYLGKNFLKDKFIGTLPVSSFNFFFIIVKFLFS